MSQAFEITPEDVANVLAQHKVPTTEKQTQKTFEEYIAPQTARIEKAALYGDEIDEQTKYAEQEIKAILTEAGVIPAR